MTDRNVRRGDLFYCELNSENETAFEDYCPVVVLQSNCANRKAKMVIVAPIKNDVEDITTPTHIFVKNEGVGEEIEGIVVLEWIRPVSRDKLYRYSGAMSEKIMKMIDKALAMSVGLIPYESDKGYAERRVWK